MEKKNQLALNMLRAAKERLLGKNPREIARRAGVEFDGAAFCFASLGRNVRISHPDYEIAPDLPHWQVFTLLHYLDLADGTPPAGRMISFTQMKDGMVRGGGFDRDAENIIRDKLGRMNPKRLEENCLAMGAKLMESNADLCAEFRFAPHFPLWLKLWFADDEFEASGRLFIDANADHHLAIEDAVTAGTLVLEMLCDK